MKKKNNIITSSFRQAIQRFISKLIEIVLIWILKKYGAVILVLLTICLNYFGNRILPQPISLPTYIVVLFVLVFLMVFLKYFLLYHECYSFFLWDGMLWKVRNKQITGPFCPHCKVPLEYEEKKIEQQFKGISNLMIDLRPPYFKYWCNTCAFKMNKPLSAPELRQKAFQYYQNHISR